jgi:hypothetical protein
MAERRLNQLLIVVVVVLGIAVVWDSVNDWRAAPPRPEPSATDTAADVPVAPPSPEISSQAGRVEPVPPVTDAGPSYIMMLARAEARRQLRAGARSTYLNEIVAKSADSVLHRWDNRIREPVRVHLGQGGVANYQPAFSEAVRAAFRRWQEVGLPVRFDLNTDSLHAEVRVGWRLQFEIDRTGQTDLTWNADGHHQTGLITLATFNQTGQPMSVEEIRIVAMHEIGHLLGLDHSPDSTDLMYPVARVRDLSARDMQSARLLYQLSPGSLR